MVAEDMAVVEADMVEAVVDMVVAEVVVAVEVEEGVVTTEIIDQGRTSYCKSHLIPSNCVFIRMDPLYIFVVYFVCLLCCKDIFYWERAAN